MFIYYTMTGCLYTTPQDEMTGDVVFCSAREEGEGKNDGGRWEREREREREKERMREKEKPGHSSLSMRDTMTVIGFMCCLGTN
jgi:hypothetical protein